MSESSSGAGMSPEQMQEAIAGLVVARHASSRRSGRCDFFDGVPSPTRSARVYDALDLMRGIEVFLNAVPGGVAGGDAEGVCGPRASRRPGSSAITEPRANSSSLFLTPNTETTYGTTFLDLRAWGPTVIEAPPQSLCVVDDFWFRYVADMGIAGPDRARAASTCSCRPATRGRCPTATSSTARPTFTNWVVFRALGGVPAMKQTRIYPLAEAAARRTNEFINLAELSFNTVHANDFSFFEEVDEIVQEEPVEALDPERAGQLAAIGIVHGQPFAPDERLRGILDAGRARSAPGIARAVAYAPRDPEAVLYGSWKNAFVGGSYEFLRDGARLLDARTQFHYLATVITPAMAHAQVGAGSAYAYTVQDATATSSTARRTYRLHVDAGPAGEELLGGRRLRHPDPVAAPGAVDASGPALASNTGDAPGQRRRLLRPLLRPRSPPKARSRTGSRPSPGSPGSRSSGSTARSSPGSTRPGSSTSSNRSTGERV